MSQSIPVIVHMDIGTIAGVINVNEGSRISDTLNTPDKYIKFTKMMIKDGVVEETSDIYVNKEEIKFVRTMNRDDGRGLGDKYYLHTKKNPIRTKMQMTDYELSGYLYSKNAQEISALLEKETPFLPCTDVQVHHLPSNLSSQVGFLAINREKIFSFQSQN